MQHLGIVHIDAQDGNIQNCSSWHWRRMYRLDGNVSVFLSIAAAQQLDALADGRLAQAQVTTVGLVDRRNVWIQRGLDTRRL
jgi:hypothetical protein